jgi:protein gp37
MVHLGRLNEPDRWRKPRIIGVGFMGDIFHEEMGELTLRTIYHFMARNPRHIFVVLTKRAARQQDFVARLYSDVGPRPFRHIWHGVSIEDQAAENRFSALSRTPGKRWLSVEPLIGSLSRWLIGQLIYVDWVVVGGEQGPKARPMNPDWPQAIRDRCCEVHLPFYFKQWGEWFPQPYGDWDDDHTRIVDGVRMWRYRRRAIECGHNEFRRLNGLVYDAVPPEFKQILEPKDG